MVYSGGISSQNLANSRLFQPVLTAVVQKYCSHSLFEFAELTLNTSFILSSSRSCGNHYGGLFNMLPQLTVIMNRFVVVQQGLWCPTKKLATVIEGFTDAISGFSVSYYDGCMTNGRLINYALPVILPDLSTTGKNGLNSFSIGYQDTARQASCRFASITRHYIYTFDGRKRYMRLKDGGYPDVSLADAREEFDIAKVKVKNGIDPLTEKEKAKIERQRTPFVSDFVDEFIEKYAKEHNRSWKEIERALKAEIVPRWGKRKLTDITRRDLVLVLDEIKERGAPVMANRVLAYTRKMFSWAVSERAVLDVNPFLMMSRPSKETSRERALSEAEIRTFWHNLDDCRMSDQIKRALKLILVTGQRPGEIIGMHRNEISGDWWEIPAARSKNKMAHRVFLTGTAKKLIGDAEGYIFESPFNPGKSYEVRTLTHDIKANLPHTPESKVIDRIKIAHFTPHDLRRSAATRWAEMEISGDMIDRLQNHITKQKQGVGHIYNRYSYSREKQQALEAWKRKLNGIVIDTKNIVVSISSHKNKA